MSSSGQLPVQRSGELLHCHGVCAKAVYNISLFSSLASSQMQCQPCAIASLVKSVGVTLAQVHKLEAL